MRPGRAVANFDSASAMLLATANALQEKAFPHLGQGALPGALVRRSGLLPLPVRQRVFAVLGGREGVPPRRLGDVDLGAVAAWAVDRYPRRTYPAVFIGSSNGALCHIYAALGAPWLPQTFLIPVRWAGNDPNRADRACRWGSDVAEPLLRANPDVELHHMHDRNQDELMVSQMAYFRVKYLRLPRAYQEFLAHSLQPGAPIVVVHDRTRWPVTRVGDRHVFQVGAVGGMEPPEYLAGPHVPLPDEEAAEAEWGFAEPLLDDIHRWADGHGHPVRELTYVMPQQPADVVADIYRSWLRTIDAPHRHLLVESFIVLDPWQVLRAGLVPYWTVFPVQSAAHALSAYLDDRPAFDEIDVMLFSHGVQSVGLADAAEWEALARRAERRGGLLGVDAREFPADFAVLGRYGRELRRLPTAQRRLGPPLPLTSTLDWLSRVATW